MIGIDVGGSFTDLVALDEASGLARHFKLPSTPADPALAIADGVAALIEAAGVSGEAISFLGYGTTVVTVGAVVAGPAVIEEMSATTLLRPGQHAVVDAAGNLIVTVGA